MKTILKVVVAGCLTFLFMSSAQAWVCYMHNARGQNFEGFGYSRDSAASHVMRKCSANSVYAKNCVLDNCNQ